MAPEWKVPKMSATIEVWPVEQPDDTFYNQNFMLRSHLNNFLSQVGLHLEKKKVSEELNKNVSTGTIKAAMSAKIFCLKCLYILIPRSKLFRYILV